MIVPLKNKVPLLFCALGLWLIVAPLTFGYGGTNLSISDAFSGIALFLLGFFAYKTGKKLFYFGAILIGLWLQLAPLFLWASQNIMYLNDTMVGMVALVLAALRLGFIGEEREKGQEMPTGWSFNPSEWTPRLITVFLAMICWFLARYMASYQLGYIHHIEDPFFGDGTVKVITSQVSKLFPVSDAGLGGFVYSMEFLLGWMGGSRRWKTMPWLAVLFGLLVVPAGMTSILLIISQPVLVGAWCGLCLFIAVCMLVMILLTVPEVMASLQLLYRVKKKGCGFWQVFFYGDRTADYFICTVPIERRSFSRFGFTLQWNLLFSVFLGVWLMCSPSLFGIAHPAADIDYMMGPLIIAFSFIALSEVIRSVRLINVLFGLVLLSSPFWLAGFSYAGGGNNLIVGLAVIALNLKQGRACERYGKW